MRPYASTVPQHPPSRIALWTGAFTGFYRPDTEQLRQLDPTAKFLYSARSVILVISAQAALIAGLLALRSGTFHLLRFLLVLIGFVALHMISNLSNDYFGWKRGDDTPDSPRRRYTVHPLASGVLDNRTLITGLLILAALVGGILAFFIVVTGWIAIICGAVGLALLYWYDAAPVPLKALGLGETASFVVWGPLMVGGGYAMITGHLAWPPVLASLPYGLGVMSILVGKHTDQLEFDRHHGNGTLPALIGEETARRFNQGIIAAMYLVTASLIATGVLSVWVGLVALALPLGFRALSVLGKARPSEAPAGYVGWPLWYHRACLVHNRAFGWLYILGLAVGAVLLAVKG